MNEPHPTIPGATIREHRINPRWRVMEHKGFDNTVVIADPDDRDINVAAYDEWLPVEEARVLAEMILDAADWIDAQKSEATG
jgi:hypothetical protein